LNSEPLDNTAVLAALQYIMVAQLFEKDKGGKKTSKQ